MTSDHRAAPDGWMATGTPDGQTVTSDWLAIEPPSIDGVRIKEIKPVATSNGYLTEVFRDEWDLDPMPVGHVFQRTMYPGAVTGWHAHQVTLDRLFCCVGSVRISLYDGRAFVAKLRGTRGLPPLPEREPGVEEMLARYRRADDHGELEKG